MRYAAAAFALLGVAAGAASSPAAPVPEGDCAGVYWDLTALFEGGDRLYARVLLSRAGPGDLSAAGQGHWLAPDGTQTPFQNGRRAGRFDLGEAGRRVQIGSTGLDLAAAIHHFEVDNDRRGVKLRVEIEASDAVDLSVHEGDLAIDVVHLGSAARGRVWRSGMTAPRSVRGRATLVRTTHGACERDLVALRVDVHQLVDDAASLLIHERLAGGEERSWLGWRDASGATHSLRPAHIALEDWQPAPSGDRLPRRMRLEGLGPGGKIAIDAPHLALDPLDALPGLVRMLYWFGASPRRAWADASADLPFEAGSEAAASPPRGPALASFTLLREPSPSRPPEPGG